jgi:hypothetical protein
MAKKRKTREQKKLADARHIFTHVKNVVAPSSSNSKQVILPKFEAKTTTISANAYPFLKKDLSKTAILTLGILAFQAILFLTLKNHVFAIPGLNY